MSYYFWTAPNMVDKRMMILVVTLTLCGSRLMSLAPTAPRHDNWIIISSPTLFLLPYQIKERNYEALCQVFSQMIYRFLIGGLVTKPFARENPDALPSDMCYNVEPGLI